MEDKSPINVVECRNSSKSPIRVHSEDYNPLIDELNH